MYFVVKIFHWKFVDLDFCLYLCDEIFQWNNFTKENINEQ